MPKRLGPTAKRELALMDGLAKAISRPELQEVLEAQGGAEESRKRIQLFLDMMHDPVHSGKKLATMARDCGLSYTEMVDMIKKHRLAEGIVRMSEHLPTVMQNVAEESLSTMTVCEKCNGEGSTLKDVKVEVEGQPLEVKKVPSECKHCKGTGEVPKAGSAAARKLLFETMGLTGKTPMVAIQNNTLNVGDEDGMEGVLKLGRDRQLERPTIEAEEVKDAD